MSQAEKVSAKVFIKKTDHSNWVQTFKDTLDSSVMKEIDAEIAEAVQSRLMHPNFSRYQGIQSGLFVGGIGVLLIGIPSALRLASSKSFTAIPAAAGLMLLGGTWFLGEGMRMWAREDVEGLGGEDYFKSQSTLQAWHDSFAKTLSAKKYAYVAMKFKAEGWECTIPVWMINKDK